MSELLDFRQRYPFKPYQMVEVADGRAMECISWPWDDEGTVKINVRVKDDPTTLTTIAVSDIRPNVVVEQDYDGYFEQLVRRWITSKTGGFKHHTIVVNARPWVPDALSYVSHEGKLGFLFYSALRNGFGGFSLGDIEQIVELL